MLTWLGSIYNCRPKYAESGNLADNVSGGYLTPSSAWFGCASPYGRIDFNKYSYLLGSFIHCYTGGVGR